VEAFPQLDCHVLEEFEKVGIAVLHVGEEASSLGGRGVEQQQCLVDGLHVGAEYYDYRRQSFKFNHPRVLEVRMERQFVVRSSADLEPSELVDPPSLQGRGRVGLGPYHYLVDASAACLHPVASAMVELVLANLIVAQHPSRKISIFLLLAVDFHRWRRVVIHLKGSEFGRFRFFRNFVGKYSRSREGLSLERAEMGSSLWLKVANC
jgi:hypothetical protein